MRLKKGLSEREAVGLCFIHQDLRCCSSLSVGEDVVVSCMGQQCKGRRVEELMALNVR